MKLVMVLCLINLFSPLRASVFDGEIESLILVMSKYENDKNANIDFKKQKKYRSFRIDQCKAIVKVKEENIKTFEVDICEKKLERSLL